MDSLKNSISKQYLRPLKVLISLSIAGEAIIFLVWGLWLYPEGNILHKFLWTFVFCGFGMGAAAAAIVDIFVVEKLKGRKAILATAIISGILLGLFCNFLCFNLDMHFNYFGGGDTPKLFIWNGIVMSVLGGAFGGWLLFTEKGLSWLKILGL